MRWVLISALVFGGLGFGTAITAWANVRGLAQRLDAQDQQLATIRNDIGQLRNLMQTSGNGTQEAAAQVQKLKGEFDRSQTTTLAGLNAIARRIDEIQRGLEEAKASIPPPLQERPPTPTATSKPAATPASKPVSPASTKPAAKKPTGKTTPAKPGKKTPR